MRSAISTSSSYIPFFGVAVILGAAAVAFISSRTNRNDEQQKHVFDPYHSSALMTNGVFPDTDKIDTTLNVASHFHDKDPLPSRDSIIALFKKHVVPHQQFHGIPRTIPAGSSNLVWVPVAGGQVDVDAHFLEHDTADRKDTMRTVEKIMNDTTLLRREGQKLPWWRVHFLREPSGTGTLVFSIHHAIGDGVSLLQVFGKLLTSDSKGTPIDLSSIFAPKGRGAKGPGFLGTVLRPWLWPMAVLRAVDFAACAVELLLKPIGPFDTASPFSFAGGVAAWPPKPEDHSVIVPMGTHSLDTIKKIKTAAGKGVTVNDVEYALYAGMMRRYLMKHCGWSADQVAAARGRSMTPFAVPHEVSIADTYTKTLANQFAFILAELPLAQKTAKERVVKSNSIWNVFKTRSYVWASFWLTGFASILPLSEQQKTTRDLFCRFSVVFSNVPGPAEELFLAGSKISGLNSYYKNVIPQVIIVSSNNEMHYSLVMPPRGKEGTETDVRIALPKLWREELDEMMQQLGVTEAQ